MAVREQRYLSFLLRLWLVKQNGNEIWRASLENPHTGEQRGFASLESLIAFLHQLTHIGKRDGDNWHDIPSP